jgi:hypothetical protein
MDYAFPFSDPGEVTAARFVEAGIQYKDIFTKEFMDSGKLGEIGDRLLISDLGV